MISGVADLMLVLKGEKPFVKFTFNPFFWEGGHALWRIVAGELQIKTFDSSGRWLIAASTSATMFLCGIWLGVGANLGLFSRRDHSATVRPRFFG